MKTKSKSKSKKCFQVSKQQSKWTWWPSCQSCFWNNWLAKTWRGLFWKTHSPTMCRSELPWLFFATNSADRKVNYYIIVQVTRFIVQSSTFRKTRSNIYMKISGKSKKNQLCEFCFVFIVRFATSLASVLLFKQKTVSIVLRSLLFIIYALSDKSRVK